MTINLADKKLFFLILDKTINFLSYRLRSRKEVSDRLTAYLQRLKNTEEEKSVLKTQILDELEKLNLLNDEHFAAVYVQQRLQSKKPSSKTSITSFLYKKGIPKDVITKALLEFGAEAESASAERTAEKKLRTLAKLDPRVARNRLISYLFSKGYSPDVVYRLVDTKFKKK